MTSHVLFKVIGSPSQPRRIFAEMAYPEIASNAKYGPNGASRMVMVEDGAISSLRSESQVRSASAVGAFASLRKPHAIKVLRRYPVSLESRPSLVNGVRFGVHRPPRQSVGPVPLRVRLLPGARILGLARLASPTKLILGGRVGAERPRTAAFSAHLGHATCYHSERNHV
jgi:hypothetical protein